MVSIDKSSIHSDVIVLEECNEITKSLNILAVNSKVPIVWEIEDSRAV